MKDNYLPLLLAMLDAPVPKDGNPGESKKITDLEKRAEKIASLLKQYHTTIRLMDGHGRFVLLLLGAIISKHGEARANSLKIELVDIDQGVSAYHKSFYPEHLVAQGKLVLRSADVTTLPLSDETLVYLNFCGIAASKIAVKKLLKDAIEKPNVRIVVSWSMARKAAKSKTLSTFNSAVGPNFFMKLVETGRTDFTTYVLTRK